MKKTCPYCGEEVEEIDGKYYCECCNCYYTEDEVNWVEDSEDDIPSGCKACGGPYPDCKISCKLFDD